MTPPYNYTIRGKTDGFGAQYNAILSGLAFCEHSPDYNYIHTPLKSVSHGWRDKTNELNEFIGIPNGVGSNVKIHTSQRHGNKNVYSDRQPSNWYDEKTLAKIRGYYWSTPKPQNCKQDIAIHIRRGDVQPDGQGKDNRKRFTPNEFYNRKIPKVLSIYPEDYTIVILSEGKMSEFESIMDEWPPSLKKRIFWKLGTHHENDCEFNLITAFHQMVTAKVLVQSQSSLSYIAGILNENEVWFLSGNKNEGQRYPLDHWRLLERSDSSKTEDGTTYANHIKYLREGKYN